MILLVLGMRKELWGV